MKYRLNTYDKQYIIVDIYDVLLLNELEEISQEAFTFTHRIYLAWLNLLADKNQEITSYDIALNKNNPLKKYLSKKQYIKTPNDQHIFLYEDERFKEIDLSSKIKIRKRSK